MPYTEIDYYELLECSRDADGAAIKSSYRKLAMKYHPDRNAGDDDAEARFKAINEAYDCLKDPQKRALYDQLGHESFRQAGGGAAGGGYRGGGAGFGQSDFADIGDLFESIFGGAFGGGSAGAQKARRGADLRYDMEITLDEAFHGKTETIEIEVSQGCESCKGSGAEPGTGSRGCNMCNGYGKVRAQQGLFMIERLCPTCHGRGEVIETPCAECAGAGRVDRETALEVEIPPGVDTGTRIRLSGKGEAGPQGAPPGDLYIFIHVAQHALYGRDGTTLITRIPVSFTTASLGGAVEIPDLDGNTREVKIPAGIQSGKQISVRGAGMPVLQGRGRGDMVVEIAVETPTRLSARQKELLKEFQDTETGKECPESAGFFDRLKNAFSA